MDNRMKNEVLNESIKDLGIVNSYLKELLTEEAPTHKFFSRDKQMSRINNTIYNLLLIQEEIKKESETAGYETKKPMTSQEYERLING